MNTLMTIYPYKKYGTWMFDDEATGLREEPLIAGIPEIIELATATLGIEKPEQGFKLMFSATPFPGHQAILRLSHRGEHGGNWYTLDGTELEGWLCPALFKYFPTAPDTIYCQISALSDEARRESQRQRARLLNEQKLPPIGLSDF